MSYYVNWVLYVTYTWPFWRTIHQVLSLCVSRLCIYTQAVFKCANMVAKNLLRGVLKKQKCPNSCQCNFIYTLLSKQNKTLIACSDTLFLLRWCACSKVVSEGLSNAYCSAHEPSQSTLFSTLFTCLTTFGFRSNRKYSTSISLCSFQRGARCSYSRW